MQLSPRRALAEQARTERDGPSIVLLAAFTTIIYHLSRLEILFRAHADLSSNIVRSDRRRQ